MKRIQPNKINIYPFHYYVEYKRWYQYLLKKENVGKKYSLNKSP
jgi:hypothetical protein